MSFENKNNVLDILFKKGLAVEEHHPEEAIKYYDQILQHDDYFSKEKPKQKKFFANVLQHKGLTLKKIGKREDAQKCFTTAFTISNAVFLSPTLFTVSELEKKDKEFVLIWNQIIKNEGKLMKTKTGRVFSYQITKYKKSIRIIQHFQYLLGSPIVVKAEYVDKNLIRNAFDIFSTKGPTELKRLLNLQTLDADATHLWGIFNDPRISKMNKK